MSKEMTMKKKDVVKMILGYRHRDNINKPVGTAFAPTNIAICKYWGKRNKELNLPVTSSLSLSLDNIGTRTRISLSEDGKDQVILNGERIASNAEFAQRTSDFLDLFRFNTNMHFLVETENDVPTATGLASSASGFAALVLALDDLFMWSLDRINLSILARLGSGSASRSMWSGFVKWQAGILPDGMDSFSSMLPFVWAHLRVGLLVLSREPKKMTSREAMSRTVGTSSFYRMWPNKVAADMEALEKAIGRQNFNSFGEIIESNSLAMHACMMSSWPPIVYSSPDTLKTMHKIWALRAEGLPIYFTQDAGPNLHLFFLGQHEQDVRQFFPELDVVAPFSNSKKSS